jgi:hypothetical protein
MIRLTQSILLLLVLSVLLAACAAGDVGDIDRTEPYKIKKTALDGIWYYQSTVIDLGNDATRASFLLSYGEQYPYDFEHGRYSGEKIVFEITEKYLTGYRAYEAVIGEDRLSENSGKFDKGNPIVQFAIQSHFDIVRDYNPATGEASNVISENSSDRPWYEREYFRLDFSQNLLLQAGLNNPFAIYDGITSASFVPQTGETEAMLFSVKGEDKAWHDFWNQESTWTIDALDYFDFLNAFTVNSGTMIDSETGQKVPLCQIPAIFQGDYPTDCAPQQVVVRNAFVRASAMSAQASYTPRHYPDYITPTTDDGTPIELVYDINSRTYYRADEVQLPGSQVEAGTNEDESGDSGEASSDEIGSNDQGGIEPGPGDPLTNYYIKDTVKIPLNRSFGYFTTNRDSYQPDRGYLEKNARRYIQRFNILKPKPVPDGETPRLCPDDSSETPWQHCQIRPIIYYLAANPSVELRAAAKEAVRQWNEAFSKMIAILTGTPGTYNVIELRENSRLTDFSQHLLNPGQRFGDIRYNLIQESRYLRTGWWGYGPSLSDPETGEIISAVTVINTLYSRELAYKVKDYVDLINGDLSLDDFVGMDVGASLSDIQKLLGDGDGLARNIFKDMPGKTAQIFGQNFQQKLTQLRDLEAAGHLNDLGLAPGDEDVRGFITKILDDPKFGALNLNFSPGKNAIQAKGLPASVTNFYDPLRFAQNQGQKVLNGYYEMMMNGRKDIIFEDGLASAFSFSPWASLAQEFKDRQKLPATDPRYVDAKSFISWFTQRANTSALLHELGHNFGLKHNFAASRDILNYTPQFWDRIGGEVIDPYAGLNKTQIKNGSMMFMYSSVMDYLPIAGAGEQILGPYDLAAIKAGYGELFEVFNTKLTRQQVPFLKFVSQHNPVPPWKTLTTALQNYYHISNLPTLFGGIDKLYDRQDIPIKELIRQMTLEGYAGHALRLDQDDFIQLVPYEYCNDRQAFEGPDLKCRPFDIGFDSLEIMKYWWERYEWSWYDRYVSRGRRYGMPNAFLDGLQAGKIIPDFVQNWLGESSLYRPQAQNYSRWKEAAIYLRQDDDMARYLEGLSLDPIHHYKSGGKTTAAILYGINKMVANMTRPDFGSHGTQLDWPYIQLTLEDLIKSGWSPDKGKPLVYTQVDPEFLPICQTATYSGVCADFHIPLGIGGSALGLSDDYGSDEGQMRFSFFPDYDRRVGLFIAPWYFVATHFLDPEKQDSLGSFLSGISVILEETLYAISGTYTNAMYRLIGWKVDGIYNPLGGEEDPQHNDTFTIYPPTVVEDFVFPYPPTLNVDEALRDPAMFWLDIPFDYSNAVVNYAFLGATYAALGNDFRYLNTSKICVEDYDCQSLILDRTNIHWVTFTDPLTGLTYKAIQYLDPFADEEDPTPVIYCWAAEYLKRAATTVKQYEILQNNPELEETYKSLLRKISNNVESLHRLSVFLDTHF